MNYIHPSIHPTALQPKSGLGFPLWGFEILLFRRSVGLLWKSDQPVAKNSTYTGQHNIQTQETNIHDPSGIRTNDPSKQAANTWVLDRTATGNG
jgi:hypothetical protein